MILFIFLFTASARIDLSYPLTWKNYTNSESIIFYSKYHPGNQKSLDSYTDALSITYPIAFPFVPRVCLTIQQITIEKIDGRISFRIKPKVNISLTGFDIQSIKEGPFAVYRNWVFIFVTIGASFEVRQFNFGFGDANIFQEDNTFSTKIQFGKLYQTPPAAQTFSNGFDFVPILSDDADNEKQGARQRLTIGKVYTDGFDVSFQYLSNSYSGSWRAYGVYVAFTSSEDNFPDKEHPPQWNIVCETGTNYNDTAKKVKGVIAPSRRVETGNQFISTILWGLTGFHTPANNRLCQDGFIAIYTHVQLVDYKYEFFIEGNPNACISNWLFMGQVSWMLFKEARCLDPYFMSIDRTQCVRCYPLCKTCIDQGENQCTSCWNNMTFIHQSKYPYDAGLLRVGPCICFRNQSQYLRELRCQLCHYSCLECEEEGQFQCAVCAKSRREIRMVVPRQCVCDDGYFENFTAICPPCHTDCMKCIGPSQRECTRCVEPEIIDQLKNEEAQLTVVEKDGLFGYCGCNSGYFLNRTIGIHSFINCIRCDQTCVECVEHADTDCLQCYRGRQLEKGEGTTGRCICLEGYFLIASQCRKCHQTCKQCIESTLDDCTMCYDGWTFTQFEHGQRGTCQCTKNQYQFSNLGCLNCHQSCKTCVGGSQKDCLTCYRLQRLISIPRVIISEDGFQERINVGTCECAEGQHNPPYRSEQKNNKGVCVICNVVCESCEADSIYQCTACKLSTHRTLAEDLTCVCNPGYFNVEIPTRICEKCNSRCATCIYTSTMCITCSNIHEGPPGCQCPEGYFDNPLIECQKCYPECRKCTGPSLKECQICSTGSCECTWPQALNLITTECVDGFNLDYSTSFSLYQEYEIIDIDFSEVIFYLSEDNRRMLPIIDCGETHNDNLYFQRHQNLDIKCYNNQEGVQILEQNTLKYILPIPNCAYTFNYQSVTHHLHASHYRIQYTSPFDMVLINVMYKNTSSIINIQGYPLSPVYGMIGSITLKVGPYIPITDEILNNYLYRFLAEQFYSFRFNQSLFQKIVIHSQLPQILLPSLQGVALILQIAPNMPQNLYFMISMFSQTIFKNVTEYSFQIRNTSVQNLTILGYQFDNTYLQSYHDITPRSFRNLDNTSLFLLDTERIVIVFLTLFIIQRLAQHKARDQSTTAYLLMSPFWFAYRSFYYQIVVSTILQLQIIFESDANEVLASISVMIIINVMYYWLGYKILEEFYRVLEEELYRINNEFSERKRLKPFHLQKHSLKYRQLMIVYFAFFGKTRQETLFIRHAQMIMKRLTLALVVTSPLSSETKIILVIVVQTVYIVFKVFFRPYTRAILLCLRLLGDCCYLVALVLLLTTHRDLQKHFDQARDSCSSGFDSVPVFNAGWIISILLIVFVVLYLLDGLVTLLEWWLQHRKSLRRQNCLKPRIYEHNDTNSELSVIEPEPDLQTDQQIMETQFNVLDPPQLVIQCDKIYSCSKLFTQGVGLNNELIFIRWQSKLIKDDETLDFLESSGVQYIITILNKSEVWSVQFRGLRMETIEFEQKKDILETPGERTLLPQQSKAFEIVILMKFTSLDSYEDRIHFQGQWKRTSRVTDYEDFEFYLCSSEIKLIEHVAYDIKEELQELNREGLRVIVEQSDLPYIRENMEVLLWQNLMSDSLHLKQVHAADGLRPGSAYLGKMLTHFHLYPRLQMYLEINLSDDEPICSIQVITSNFDHDLIIESGYLQVIKRYVQSMRVFLAPNEWEMFDY